LGEWRIDVVEREIKFGFYQAFNYHYSIGNCNNASRKRGTIKFGVETLQTSSKAFTCLIQTVKSIHTLSLTGQF